MAENFTIEIVLPDIWRTRIHAPSGFRLLSGPAGGELTEPACLAKDGCVENRRMIGFRHIMRSNRVIFFVVFLVTLTTATLNASFTVDNTDDNDWDVQYGVVVYGTLETTDLGNINHHRVAGHSSWTKDDDRDASGAIIAQYYWDGNHTLL